MTSSNITFYAAPSNNSRKISIALAEINLPYKLELLDLSKGLYYNGGYQKQNI